MDNTIDMRVIKRNGELEDLSFDKILNRIRKLGQEAGIQINYQSLIMKVIDQLYDKIPTTKIDELAAEQCAGMSTNHPDYATLAGRIVVSNHQKNTDPVFSNVMEQLYEFRDIHGTHYSLVSESLHEFTQRYSQQINEMIVHDRDYLIDYFGFKTLERAYLFKLGNKIIERPQHMWMRVAIGIHGNTNDPNALNLVKETYELMSQKYFTHATPTLFNAGTPRPQMSSCYLVAMEDDSLDGIYNTLKDCAIISKWAGGVGLHIHNIRAKGSHILGTNGTSNGLVPMLRVFNNTARYVDQCVHPETVIYTDKGPIQIQHCSSHETKIFNLTGNCELIENVLEHPYEDEIYNIETTHCIDNLKITPEHPIFVLRNQKKGLNYELIKNRLDKNIISFEWIETKELTLDDMIVYTIPNYEVNIESLTEEDCYMYGVILGDGCMHNTDQNGYISLHTTNKKHILDFSVKYFENKCIQYKIDINENTTKIRWNKNINMPFRYSDVYDINKEKYVSSKWLNLPINKSKFILKGLLDTDGSSDKELVFDNTSRNLIESARFICLKMGLLTSGYIRDRVGESHMTQKGIITNKKISYCLRIPKIKEICELINIPYDDNQFFKFFKYNNYLLSRVKNITKEQYSGTLYDLQFKNEHNYMIHNGIVHNGGGKRNGSFAIYLEPWHADVEDFLEMKKNHGDEEMKARDLFYALWISDLFMERVKSNAKWSLMCPHECPGLSDVYGDDFVKLYEKYEADGKMRKCVNARDLWFKILDAQMETGTPYLLYKDAANIKSNQKNLGTVKSSNLCVAPETLILTDKGHIEIQTLANKSANVWNGEEWSSVIIKKTGVDQELIDVYTDDGSKLTCTPYHKFYIQNNYSSISIEKVDAKDLKPNDKIIKCEYPVIDGCDKMPYAYTHGFFCGDGTYSKITDKLERCCQFKALPNHYFCKRHLAYETESYLMDKEYILEGEELVCQAKSYVKKPIAYLYGDKKQLLEYIDKRSYTESSNRINISLPVDLNEKFDIPSNFCSLKDKLDWFAGYCDADGSICRNGNNEQLQVSSINKEFLENIKLMLQTCGINPKIKLSQNRTESYLPDGRGGYKYFDVKPIYRLLITSCDLYNLHNLGFKPKRLIVSGNKPARDAKQFIKILKVENNNRIDDTYCFTEPKKNMGVFNGIITGQCTEIMEYSDDKETAVCNLASIGLPSFVNKETKDFNYDKLHEVTKVITNNLNRVIDINFYPTDKTKRSNMRHRPIGIGVQGLADTFILMDIAFHSDEAKEVNKLIFETIYHAALEKSNEIAIERKEMILEKCYTRDDLLQVLNEYEHDAFIEGNISQQNYLTNSYIGSYSSFNGSPASQGILQFDMWSTTPSDRYDWASLKLSIVRHGLRNSLLVAPMPTASTSQILGFNECFEPFTSNLYSRRTLAGEFVVVNKYLMKELIDLGYWNEQIKNNIIANKGSVQQLTVLSEHLRNKYKIVWEIPMKHVIDMAADRGAFICQSQSLNLWVEDPTYNTLTSMHFYSWKKGLKTGIYYLRRKAKHQAQQFTIEPEQNAHGVENDEICEMCSA